ADDILAPRIARTELDRVVIDVPGAISGQRSGDERLGVDTLTERIDASGDRSIRSIQLKHRSAESRVVEEVADQHAVIDGLPYRTAERHGLPVALEIPHLSQRAVLPTESLLVPGLR